MIERGNAYYSCRPHTFRHKMDSWTKGAFLIGFLLTASSVLVRMFDFIDNSTTLPFFVIGTIIVIMGERNRVRLEETPVSAD